MKLSVALHYLLLNNGYRSINDERLVVLLSEYGVFEDKPSMKNIINTLVSDGYLNKILGVSTLDERNAIIRTFLYNTGLDAKKVVDVLNIILSTYNKFQNECRFRNLLQEEFVETTDSLYVDGGIYTPDGAILIGCQKGISNLSIREGCIMISVDSLWKNDSWESITISKTVKYISNDAIPYNKKIFNESPYFVLEMGLFMTADRKRLLKCNSDNFVIELPKEIIDVDNLAFDTNSSEVKLGACFGYNRPPYFLKLCSDNLKQIVFEEAYFVAATAQIKDHLLKNGIHSKRIIEGDIFVDSFGAIYSEDKRTLLCFPKELRHAFYEVIDECEILADDAFYYSGMAPNGGQIDDIELDLNDFAELCGMSSQNQYLEKSCEFRFTPNDFADNDFFEGNKVEILKLPKRLAKIGNNAFSGLVNLKTIIYYVDSLNNVKQLLEEYDKDGNSFHVLEKVALIPIRSH